MEQKPKKQQKKSVSYALKAFTTHAKTLVENKLITKEDAEKILEITKKAVNKHISDEYNI